MRNLLVILFLFGFISNAQYTLIPDEEFESRLIDQGIDTQGILDGQVLTDDIDHITVLNVFTDFPYLPPYINDLTGIEDFISLEVLNFSTNEVQLIDISNLSNLKSLVGKFNNLTSIDVSNNLLLENLDLTNCPEGTCEQENTFDNLDLSNNFNLLSLTIGYNNYVSAIDLSNNSLFDSASIVWCPLLEHLNIRNGNNTNLFPFIVIENPLLYCIDVDDPQAATEATIFPYSEWNIQENVVFSEDCSLGIDDNLFEEISIYPNPVKDILKIDNTSTTEITSIKLYDVLGRLVLVEKVDFNQIDVSHLDSGVLFVEIETDQGIVTKKIIKE